MSGQRAQPILNGTCYVTFAYDIGISVDLDSAERELTEPANRKKLEHRRKTPSYFSYEPAPIRFSLSHSPFPVAQLTTANKVEVVLFDFAAISITFQIPFTGGFEKLLDLSEALYDNAKLLDLSRTAATEILDLIRPAVTKPGLSDFVEDYVVFGINDFTPTAPVSKILESEREILAQILRAERTPLSDQEITDALVCHIGFGRMDLAIVDWNASIVFDEAFDDTLSILEYANVELLEMRYLDDQLDDALDRSNQLLSRHLQRRRFWPDPATASLRELAELRMDSVALFEGVNNAIKLVGDQYLARLYRLAAQRLHLEDWDTSILRKLEALESASEKVSMLASHRRAEVLEWIIIILIMGSIGLELVMLLQPRAGH